MERTHVFLKGRTYILGSSNFLCLPQIIQYNFFIFLVIENVLMLFYHFSHSHKEEVNFYNLANFYLKSLNYLTFYLKSINLSLYSINIWYDIFVSYEFLNFFWNMFNSKAIKIYCIIRCSSVIIIQIHGIQ